MEVHWHPVTDRSKQIMDPLSWRCEMRLNSGANRSGGRETWGQVLLMGSLDEKRRYGRLVDRMHSCIIHHTGRWLNAVTSLGSAFHRLVCFEHLAELPSTAGGHGQGRLGNNDEGVRVDHGSCESFPSYAPAKLKSQPLVSV